MEEQETNGIDHALGRIRKKKERILGKKPSERTESELAFLRRFGLHGTVVTHPSRFALDSTQEISKRVVSNALYLVSISGYSHSSLRRYFDNYNIKIDLLDMDKRYKGGQKISMSLYVPVLLASHFQVSAVDMLFTDLSDPGSLPAGYSVPSLPEEYGKPKRR